MPHLSAGEDFMFTFCDVKVSHLSVTCQNAHRDFRLVEAYSCLLCCLDVPCFGLFDVLVDHGALFVGRGDGGLTKGIFTVSAAQILHF